MTITLQDIRKASELISSQVAHTPCSYSRKLSEMIGAKVILKFENLQFVGAFKERGALVKLLSLRPEQRQKGVIAMSAGNHAQAVAYQAQRLGIPAVIVMPHFTPNAKVERTRSFGAEVILHGEILDETFGLAQQIAQERQLCIVPPYDDEKIITGQGTMALEMLAADPDLQVLVVPVGGGGLISGNAIAAKSLNPNIKIVGVQTARFPSMLQALEGKPTTCGGSTIADGIAIKAPGKLTLPIVQKLVDKILLVDEGDIEESVRLLLELEKTVVEGAGAVGLAALLVHRQLFVGRKVGVILSGGNIDLLTLSSIIQRSLVRSGRLARLCVQIRDVPGALSEVTRCIGDVGGNIVELHHQRAFSSLPLQLAEVEFVLQTRGLQHLQQIIDTLIERGFQSSLKCGV